MGVKKVKKLSGTFAKKHEVFYDGVKSCSRSTAIIGVTRQHMLVLTEIFRKCYLGILIFRKC